MNNRTTARPRADRTARRNFLILVASATIGMAAFVFAAIALVNNA